MEFGPQKPYLNGNHHVNHDAPLATSGASSASAPRSPQPTVFPDPIRLAGPSATLYGLHRFHIGGAPISRWPVLLFGALALVWATGALPGRWIGVGVWILLFAGFIAYGVRLRRRHYVSFAPTTPPDGPVAPLHPQDKVPVYATGLLGVEGRERPFTFLPGFYRTFATGEHAVLCRAAPRRWLGLGAWPPEEQGMWYAFVQPDAIVDLAWGEIKFGVTQVPAAAVTHRVETSVRGGRTRVSHETLYLACSVPTDAARIFMDLHRELPADRVTTPLNSRARRQDPS